jgi:ferredoxin
LKSEFDLQLTDLGDRFAVETGSDAGVAMVARFGHIFSPAKPADQEDLFESRLASQSSFDLHVNLEQVRRTIISGSVTDEFWESVAARCFECGGCVYNCPVCTCFTVSDRAASAESGARLRLWDTCMFKGFTRTAGGFVPAEQKLRRTKRWYHHKLVHWPAQFGAFGCVGCGRCAISCPGKIDMATVALRIKDPERAAEKD